MEFPLKYDGEFDEDSVWTTETGRKIKVKDLADDHLIAIIVHLRGRGKDLKKRVINSLYGKIDSSDRAKAAWLMKTVNGYENMTPDDFMCEVIATYKVLLNELDKRGLECKPEKEEDVLGKWRI